MMKKKSLIYILIFQFFFCGLLVAALNSTIASSNTSDYYDLKSSAVDFSNATVVSDGFNNSYWNDDNSYNPAIAVDSNDKVHAVWEDNTPGVWGTDREIMYATYTTATGWSNATVISDGYSGIYWNDGTSLNPAIAIDSSNAIHVVWEDETDAGWGIDTEIMYACTSVLGWSMPKIISDGYNGSYWNDASSLNPAIAIDSSNAIHVVWYDGTPGVWGTDTEIMYANFTIINRWSNITVISDGYNGVYWNDGHSYFPAIAINTNQVHIVWYDDTDGVWGTDTEIMHANFAIPVVSDPGGIPLGNFYLLFIAVSIIGLVAYKKRKI